MVTKIKPYRIRDVNEPEEGNSLQYNDPNTFVRGEGGGGGSYVAGENIQINGNVISATDTKAEWGNITGTLSDQTDLQSALDDKQDTLIAGTNIQISGQNVISATGGADVDVNGKTLVITDDGGGGGGGGGSGDVVGPSSAVDGHLAVFDGTTGKLIKDGGAIPTSITVVDNLNSTSTTSALSANQGRILDGKIADMMGLGKFLSLWNSTTGLPISFPLDIPYAYTTGDYFIIEVTGTTNYKPVGSSYAGTASSTAETDEIEVGDVYVYDGQTWLLQSNHGKTVTFANIAGNPTDNTNLANALSGKQDVSNLVTSVSSSSTDSQYPSAKLFYDTCGDIETLINAL